VGAKVSQVAAFPVNAIGTGALSYQWRLDGAPLPGDDPHFIGVQSDLLTVSPLLYAHEGGYDVIVTDECGPLNAVTSKVAKLTIKPGPQWVLRTTNGPAARTGPAMAYDTKRHVTVLFGGAIPDDAGQLYPLNDLWEWNGARWARRMTNSPTAGWIKDQNGRWHPDYTGNQPTPRFEHAMAYDSRQGRVVLFAGRSLDPSGFDTALNEVWEWDGTRWYFRTTGGTNGPASHFGHVMAYDSDRGVAVMYGGFDLADQGILWEWNGNSWTRFAPADGPLVSDSQDEGAMAYDSFHRVTFFGPGTTGSPPFFLNNFWNWDGAKWFNRGAGFSLTIVSPRDGAMVFDSYRRRSIYFGGISFTGAASDLTASWDDAGWSLLATAPDTPPPSARFNHATAYDSLRHAVVMLGGETDPFAQPPHKLAANSTWELIAVDTPLINDQPASQYRPSGDTAIFSVSAVGPPGTTLTYQWYHDDQLIGDDSGGHIVGLGTPALKILKVTAADAGTYRAVVAGDCGETTTWPATLTLEPKLQVFTAADTSTLIWSDPSVVLEQAHAITGPWTPVPGAASPFDIARVGPGNFFRLRPTSP
jgi:hypothetical protein